MSPRESPATAGELARVGLFASLAGETLVRVAKALRREDVAAGGAIDADDRFVVVLNGMASGGGRMLRPGDKVDPEPGRALRAVTPVTIATCDRATYDEVVRPQLGKT